jgi:hypothetical protein
MAARAAARASRGGVFFPPGAYLLDTALLIDWDGASLETAGLATKLIPRVANQTVLKIAASHCIIGDLSIDNPGGLANVEALVIAPTNEALASPRTDVNYNRIGRVWVNGCTEAVRMRAGPGTRAGDSGCWYNTVREVVATFCRRGIWLQSPPGSQGGGASRGSPVNRNSFYDVRIGQDVNTGIQIDAGATNDFYHVSCEGVVLGTAPNRIPTAVKIAASDRVTGWENHYNRFFGLNCEACSRDIENDNVTTEFHGALVNASKCAGAYPLGGLMLTGSALLGWHARNRLPGPLDIAGPLTVMGSQVVSGEIRSTGAHHSGRATNANVPRGDTWSVPIPATGFEAQFLVSIHSNWNPTISYLGVYSSDGLTGVWTWLANGGSIGVTAERSAITFRNNFPGTSSFITSILRLI